MNHPIVVLAALLLAANPVWAEPDISAPEALAAAQAGKLKLIDIRSPAEWRETGVAPGSGKVDFYKGPQTVAEYILRETGGDKNAPIALICRTGNRTTTAQKYLQGIGFTQVYNVREGMKGSAAGPGWLKRGLPVESCDTC